MKRSAQEIECKFIGVDPAALEKQFKELGAKRHFKKLFRRYVFDHPDLRLNANNSWLRVRDEGDQVTMAFKRRRGTQKGQPDKGMDEIEIIVNDFEKSADLLRAIGMKPKFYEENWRTMYTLDGVELSIDEWPLIPPYMEIEGSSWEEVDNTAKKLGFKPSEKFVCATMQIYEHYDINENDYAILTFDRQEKVRA